MAAGPWKVLSERRVIERRWLTVREQRIRTQGGVEIAEFHLLDAPDWVAVVAMTPEQDLVLVRQYRHGVGASTLELPAGAVEAGEPPQAAAERELAEETGFVATKWTRLGTISPEPSRHTYRAHLFLAEGARRLGAQALDDTEDVQVELWPSDSPRLASELCHGVHLGALFLASCVRGQLFGSGAVRLEPNPD